MFRLLRLESSGTHSRKQAVTMDTNFTLTFRQVHRFRIGYLIMYRSGFASIFPSGVALSAKSMKCDVSTKGKVKRHEQTVRNAAQSRVVVAVCSFLDFT